MPNEPTTQSGANVAYNEAKDLRKGEEVMLFHNDKPIAYCTSINPDFSVGEDDVSSKMSGEWDSSLPGRISYSYNVESMVSVNKDHVSYDLLLYLQLQREPILVKECTTSMTVDPTSGDKTFKAVKVLRQFKCIITNLAPKSSAGERDTFSCTLKGVTPIYGETWGKPLEDPTKK